MRQKRSKRGTRAPRFVIAGASRRTKPVSRLGWPSLATKTDPIPRTRMCAFRRYLMVERVG